jgi:hypothetical protein
MVIYRGESVSDGRPNRARVEVIRRFHKTGQGLWTEMANNGDPYRVVSLGLLEATRKHVAFDARLGKTHFLSFSADESRALFYAGAHEHDQDDVVAADRSEDDVWPHTHYWAVGCSASVVLVEQPAAARGAGRRSIRRPRAIRPNGVPSPPPSPRAWSSRWVFGAAADAAIQWTVRD